jgi:hypothetical protein
MDGEHQEKKLILLESVAVCLLHSADELIHHEPFYNPQ